MKRALVVQHVQFEDLGNFESPLLALGYSIHYEFAWNLGQLPERVEDFDLVVILGGPIGAYETREYPFLRDEIRLIDQALLSGARFLGVCLGAQLLAATIGGQVFAGNVKEIGVGRCRLTSEGDRVGPSLGLPHEFNVLHWHGDTFALPTSAVALVSNENYENQAFAYGARAIGLQFHLETSAAKFDAWLVGHASELAFQKIDPVYLRHEFCAIQAEMSGTAHSFVNDWLSNTQSDMQS